MTRFLFWNLDRKELDREVAAIVKDHEVDVILLAESKMEDRRVLKALGREMPGTSFALPRINVPRRISVFLRYHASLWKPLADHPRYVIGEYAPPARARILLVAVHLPSRPHTSERSINHECMLLGERIRAIEKDHDTERTLVVGDLNLNPFDEALVTAAGLHGVMSKEVASERRRVVNGQEFSFFYNPMWSRLGDSSIGPPGSYYYRDSQQLVYFWHTYDQVLLRPALLEEFEDSSLQFLTTIRGTSLLRRGAPDRQRFSDHLPLLFELKLRAEAGSQYVDERKSLA